MATHTKVNPNQKRAQDRLAALRLANPKALPHVAPRSTGNFERADRYAILHATQKAAKDAAAKKKAAADKPAPYNPLAPVAGKDFDAQIKAATTTEFAPEEAKLRDAYTSQANREPVVGNAFDQYHSALVDAANRMRDSYKTSLADSQGAVNTAYTQDKASQDQRDAAAAAKAALYGQQGAAAPGVGGQAVEAMRSQGNQTVAAERTAGDATVANADTAAATSLQAKATALQNENDRKAALDQQAKDLAGRKGAFAVDQKGKLRDTERTYALASKEFGLKAADTASMIKTRAASTKVDRQKAAAQVLVAKIYAAADRSKARATIRVAKLQLEKGKIDQKQYRHILNEYKGLPKKGQPGQPKGATTGKNAGGSGPGGTLAPWEQDAQDKAYNGFNTNKYTADDHARAIEKAVTAGIPKRMAEAAWKRYVKTLHGGVVVAPDGSGQQRPT